GAERLVLHVNPPERFLEKLAVRNRGAVLDQLAQLDGHPFARQRLDALAQYLCIGTWSKRQALVVVGEKKAVDVEVELNLLRLQRLAVGLAEDGEEHFADGLAARRDRSPIDVEVVEKARVLAIFENAHPPRVL